MDQGITIVGLGPGNPNQLTVEAAAHLDRAEVLYLRTLNHPVAAVLSAKRRVNSFDSLDESTVSIEAASEQIVGRVLQLGRQPGGVTYAVPGSPSVGEATCTQIIRQAVAEGIPVSVIEGISCFEPACNALGIDPLIRLVLVDALELAAGRHVSFPPSFPALITHVNSTRVAAQLKATLLTVYPAGHPVQWIHNPGDDEEQVEALTLGSLDSGGPIDGMDLLYIPPISTDSSFEDFQAVVAHLRDPRDGCPWDLQQTHVSLRKALLEEAYEALKAIDEGDPRKLAEELGDLLLQIVLHARIAGEAGDFSMVDVLQGINRKIVHRHPHVFGDQQLRDMDHLLQNWEKLKARERKQNGQAEKSLLDGVPDILPALEQAQEVQARAARVGFDWKDVSGVLEKISEEVREIEQVQDHAQLTEEIGDLLFALVNYARWRKVESEFALRDTITKFRKRFGYIELKAGSQGREVAQMSFEELDTAWEEAKLADI